jgi:hypothetical protein
MALSPSQGKKTLIVRRGCKRSRLEAQLLAAAYEFLTPIAKRSLSASPSDGQPKDGPTTVAEPRPRRAGGNRA